jgi:hypothetical protein
LQLASCCHDAGLPVEGFAGHARSPAPNTWRYPPRCTDEIEVER